MCWSVEAGDALSAGEEGWRSFCQVSVKEQIIFQQYSTEENSSETNSKEKSVSTAASRGQVCWILTIKF